MIETLKPKSEIRGRDLGLEIGLGRVPGCWDQIWRESCEAEGVKNTVTSVLRQQKLRQIYALYI